MKNAIFWILVAIVAVILGLLAYGIYLSVTHASPFDVATAVCTGFVLVGSLVAWELLMKPGYYRRRKEASKAERSEAEERDETPGTPPSR